MSIENNDIERNRPAERGRDNDTNLRDDSALQPGVSTISSSGSDDANNELTRTAGDGFTENLEGENDADLAFDEVDVEDDK